MVNPFTQIPSKESVSFLPSESSVSDDAPKGASSVGVSVKPKQAIPSIDFMKHGVYALQSTVLPFPVKVEPSADVHSEEEPLLVIGTTVMDSKVR